MADITSNNLTQNISDPVKVAKVSLAARSTVIVLENAGVRARLHAVVIIEAAKAGIATAIGLEPVLPQPCASERAQEFTGRKSQSRR